MLKDYEINKPTLETDRLIIRTMILSLGLRMNCIVKLKSSHIWNCLQTDTDRCLCFFL